MALMWTYVLVCFALWSQHFEVQGLIPVVSTAQSVPDVAVVDAVEGHSTQLPCDITPPNAKEQVYLVLWYRQDEGEPIYSYDARSSAGATGNRWSDERPGFGFGQRAHFQLGSANQEQEQQMAYLNVQDVQRGEAGVYRCRVDFKTAPTRNALVNLTVIVPPSIPSVFDESGNDVRGVVGPYLVGETVVLKCISSGGVPTPEVTWWVDGQLQDSTFDETYSGTVQNTLTLKDLKKSDLGRHVTCQAKNNDLSIPVRTKVTIDLKFPPSTVSISNQRPSLSAGKTYSIECRSAGSRPAATITWYRNRKIVFKGVKSQVLENGNVTVSTLSFTPSVRDQGRTLTCRAENVDIREAALEKHWKLTIHHAPVVSLNLGPSLDKENIAEGNDVYFECRINANPKVYKVIWLHDDVMVTADPARGVLITGESLVLQGVTRMRAGKYACVASNLEGDTQSNIVELKIKFKPVCANHAPVTQGLGRGRVSRILCPVLAHPPPKQFTWTFNNSIETVELPSSRYHSNDTHSQLRYRPDGDDGFGLLRCFARNEMGEMDMPCSFNLIPAGPPDPPTNCSVVNQTTDSLEVWCSPGFDGGLRQRFVMVVADAETGRMLANATEEDQPEFTVSGLNSGRGLKMRIFAVNADGASNSTILEGNTLKVAELQIESPVPLEFTPVLGILIGVVVTLLVVSAAVFLLIRCKYTATDNRRRKRKSNSKVDKDKSLMAGRRVQLAVPEDEEEDDEGGEDICLKAARPTERDDEEYYCLKPKSPLHIQQHPQHPHPQMSPLHNVLNGGGSDSDSGYHPSSASNAVVHVQRGQLQQQQQATLAQINGSSCSSSSDNDGLQNDSHRSGILRHSPPSHGLSPPPQLSSSSGASSASSTDGACAMAPQHVAGAVPTPMALAQQQQQHHMASLPKRNGPSLSNPYGATPLHHLPPSSNNGFAPRTNLLGGGRSDPVYARVNKPNKSECNVIVNPNERLEDVSEDGKKWMPLLIRKQQESTL